MNLGKFGPISMDESGDLFNAEEPNDESYHDNTNEDQMNLDKTKIRKILRKILKKFNIVSKPPFYPA